jgi:hypothetical protein
MEGDRKIDVKQWYGHTKQMDMIQEQYLNHAQGNKPA